MHEFLLFGQIPDLRHSQVLNILAGATASQPTAFEEQHLLYAPRKAEANILTAKRKGQQQVNKQLYYLDIYRSSTALDGYKVRINQEPEPGSQQVISRNYTLQEVHDVRRYDDGELFDYIGQQLHTGDFFVHGNVLLRVYRILVMNKPADKPIHANFPALKWFNMLDDSGAYIVDASIRLEDRSNSKLADLAVKELMDTKRLLQGAIELYVPDRLSLDTRVKST